jgi:hypothetical protein
MTSAISETTLTVSSKEPFNSDEKTPAVSVDKTPPPSRNIAASKEKRVLILGTKKRLAMILPFRLASLSSAKTLSFFWARPKSCLSSFLVNCWPSIKWKQVPLSSRSPLRQ